MSREEVDSFTKDLDLMTLTSMSIGCKALENCNRPFELWTDIKCMYIGKPLLLKDVLEIIPFYILYIRLLILTLQLKISVPACVLDFRDLPDLYL